MDPLYLRIITHNIRYAASNTLPGEEPWPVRLPRLVAQMRYNSSTAGTFVCMQEVLWHQLVDLLSALNASTSCRPQQPLDQAPGQHALSTDATETQLEWDFVGVGRDDGYKAGEFNPILYRPKIWRVLDHRTEWLSPRPHQRGWDAGSNRLVEIAHFQHRETERILVVMNTHLDNQGTVARREAARMLNSLAQDAIEIYDEKLPVVLTGDLNSDEQGEAYAILNEAITQDSRQQVAQEARYGDENTFTGFQGRDKDKERIDYIFNGPCAEQGRSDSLSVKMYAVLPNRFDDGIYLSDHRPVAVDLELP